MKYDVKEEQFYPSEDELHSGIFCSECGEEILVGYEYWKVGDVILCEECLQGIKATADIEY